jgi:hypothetical protein
VTQVLCVSSALFTAWPSEDFVWLTTLRQRESLVTNYVTGQLSSQVSEVHTAAFETAAPLSVWFPFLDPLTLFVLVGFVEDKWNCCSQITSSLGSRVRAPFVSFFFVLWWYKLCDGLIPYLWWYATKVKVKLFLCLTKHHAMKAYWGSVSIDPRILDLGTRWGWAVNLTPQPLYSEGKCPWYPLDRRLSGPQSRSGRDGEEKNSQPPLGIEP